MPIPRPVRVPHARGFFAEIAVIVVGVLIALAAGQWLEEWNWGRKVDAGEQQLVREALGNLGYASEQVSVQPCLDAQLDALRDRVLASDATLQPAPVYRDDTMRRFVFRAPSRPYVDSTWQALNDDGTSVHMHDDRRELMSAAYGAVDILNELTSASDLVVGRMMTLSHPLPLDPGTRVMLVQALDEQQARTALQSLVAAQLLAAYRDFGATIPPGDDFLENSGTVAFCRKHGLPLDDWREVLRAQPPVQD